jgi:hypothetical protein
LWDQGIGGERSPLSLGDDGSRGGSKGGLGGLQPPYNPDFSIKYVFISLKSSLISLISSFSLKFSLFSPPFEFILDPPLDGRFRRFSKEYREMRCYRRSVGAVQFLI